MKKWGIYLSIAIITIIGVFGGVYFFKQQEKINAIASFEECTKAGFPVMDSYPPQCRVPNGKSFTQNIGNELEFSEEFLLSSPRPNQKITSPLSVSGQARGIWFFEGSFSGELYDSNKKLLGTVILQATAEWMTEEFVPFKGELQFDTPTIDRGELIIKNANPSGLSEHEKTIIVPIAF